MRTSRIVAGLSMLLAVTVLPGLPASSASVTGDEPAQPSAATQDIGDRSQFHVVEEPDAPSELLDRPSDTMSLYAQAGMSPSRKVLAAVRARGESTAKAAATAPQSAQPDQAKAEAQQAGSGTAGMFGFDEFPLPLPATTNDAGQILPHGLVDHVDTWCGGDGTDGRRVQPVYVREADQPDRYAEVKPILLNELRYVDDVFAVSSMKAGGTKRVRWVTDGTCTPQILNVVVPDGSLTAGRSGDPANPVDTVATFYATQAALVEAGVFESDRRYMVFADDDTMLEGSVCGRGSLAADSSPVGNLNDGSAWAMSRIEASCWVTNESYHSTAIHELLHTLGAVQDDAPHSSHHGHCTDAYEVMCYTDGPGVEITGTCPLREKWDIDCGDDDYFSVDPAPGSYLSDHWNVANSSYLADTATALPQPATVTMSTSTMNPQIGKRFTLHATTDAAPGATYKWDLQGCVPDAPATGKDVTLRCSGWNGTRIFSVRVSNGTIAGQDWGLLNFTGDEQFAWPAVTVKSPTTVKAGKSFTITSTITAGVEPTDAVSYQWRSDTPGCTTSSLTGASLTVTCNSSVVGQYAFFVLDATRKWDGRVGEDAVSVRVAPAAGFSTETTLSQDGETALIAWVSADQGSMAFQPLTIQRRATATSAWETVTTLNTGAEGTVIYKPSKILPGTYRAVYAGTDAYNASTSDTIVFAGPPTPPAPQPKKSQVVNAKIKAGLKATVMIGGKRTSTVETITLWARKAGTSKWVKVKAYRTKAGVVVVKINPRKVTDYRWTYNGRSGVKAATSGVVRLT